MQNAFTASFTTWQTAIWQQFGHTHFSKYRHKKENFYTKYDIGISEDIGRGMLIPFVARIPLSNVGLKIQYVCSIVNQFFSVAFSLNLHASFFKISDYNQERMCQSRSRNE